MSMLYGGASQNCSENMMASTMTDLCDNNKLNLDSDDSDTVPTLDKEKKNVKKASCAPYRHIRLVICPECYTLDTENNIYCQNCKNPHCQLVMDCKTKGCPACLINQDQPPDYAAKCKHKDCSINGIHIVYYPVMCGLVDCFVNGNDVFLHGILRSDILLDLQYIIENQLVTTEGSANSYALFKRFHENEICSLIQSYLDSVPSSESKRLSPEHLEFVDEIYSYLRRNSIIFYLFII